ncbi:MAG: hypothetical protein ACRC46_02175 [Thermoguttaceae bacterium]
MKVSTQRSVMTWCLAAVFAVSFAATSLLTASAEECKPAFTVAVSSIDNAVKGAAKVAELAGLAEEFSKIQEGVKSAPWIDSTRPIGFAIAFVDSSPVPMIFVPAEDPAIIAEMLMSSVQAMPMQVTAKKTAPGRYEITTPVGAISLIAKDKWLRATLAVYEDKLPSDPAKLLAVPNKATIAFSFDLDQVTREEVDLLLAPIQMMVMMQQAEGGPDLSSSFDQINVALDTLFEGISNGVITLTLDPANGDFSVGGSMETRAGSEMEKALNIAKDAKIPFGGFFKPQNSIAAMCSVSPILPSQRETYKEQMSTVFASIQETFEDSEDENAAMMATTLELVSGTILATLDQDVLFSAMTWDAEGTAFGAMTVAKSDALLKAIREIASKVKADTEMSQAVRDAITVEGEPLGDYKTVRFSLPISKIGGAGDAGIPAAILAKKIDVIVGVDAKSVCFAAGIDGKVADKLAKAIADSKTPIALPNPSFVSDCGVFGKFLASFEIKTEDETLSSILNWFANLGDGGKMVGSQTIEGRTQKFDFRISGKLVAGYIKLMAKVAASQQATE